jgi:hypothetical protein
MQCAHQLAGPLVRAGTDLARQVSDVDKRDVDFKSFN